MMLEQIIDCMNPVQQHNDNDEFCQHILYKIGLC